jgi:hypothetical protein
MISITYDPRCETARFAMRNIRFVFACFRLTSAGNETGASGPPAWGASDYGTLRHHARGPESLGPAVAQFIDGDRLRSRGPKKVAQKSS